MNDGRGALPEIQNEDHSMRLTICPKTKKNKKTKTIKRPNKGNWDIRIFGSGSVYFRLNPNRLIIIYKKYKIVQRTDILALSHTFSFSLLSIHPMRVFSPRS